MIGLGNDGGQPRPRGPRRGAAFGRSPEKQHQGTKACSCDHMSEIQHKRKSFYFLSHAIEVCACLIKLYKEWMNSQG